ncbi:MAG: transposase [Thermoanaerobaculales bacterium]|nr:transposase [Thermoanaerobaculales bacterium]
MRLRKELPLVAECAVGFYRARKPQETPLYRLVEALYDHRGQGRLRGALRAALRLLADLRRRCRQHLLGLRQIRVGLCPCQMFGLWRRISRGDQLSEEGFLPELWGQAGSRLRGFPDRRGARRGRARNVYLFSAGGFSVDDSVRFEPEDRKSMEKVARYILRPPLSLERLSEMRIVSVILEHRAITRILGYLARKGIEPGRGPPEGSRYPLPRTA